MVNIDTVYQRVLALANKEQRGYITPQEYNLLANQAQMSIFESYFYAKNNRAKIDQGLEVRADEASIDELIGKKLQPFASVENMIGATIYPTTVTVGSAAVDVFQTGRVFYNNQECTKVEINEARFANSSIRHRTALGKRPIFSDSNMPGEDIKVYAGSSMPQANGVTVECFRVPLTANWTYVVVNGKALYNASDGSAQNFELHRSEEDTLVNKILELAGIIIAKPGLSQLAGQKSGEEIALQNT
tara:strand:+ start:102 stop:836 length:735 start_codon:yes stop_codon:yes gene_type:complete